MSTPRSVGVIELSSIGIGYLVQDEMLKAASVELLIARTICSGKYMIVIGGSVSSMSHDTTMLAIEESVASSVAGSCSTSRRRPRR